MFDDREAMFDEREAMFDEGEAMFDFRVVWCGWVAGGGVGFFRIA